MTSRFRKGRFLWRMTQFLLGGAAIVGAVMYANWLIHVDPFQKYRPDAPQDPTKDIGVTLEEVDFTFYDGQERLGHAQVGKIDVQRDRQKIYLYNISNGMMKTKDGEFKFDGPEAEFEQRRRTLSALKGARVWNDDLDLKLDGFVYMQRVGRFQGVGRVQGAFYEGQLLAQNFVFYPDKREATAGPVEWTGIIAGLLQDAPVQPSRKPWSIKGDRMTLKGDLAVYLKASATDGEVIVKADRIEHDRKSDVMTAIGNVLYYSARSNVTCERAIVYRKEKRSILTGNVTMLVKPKDQEKLEEAPIPPFRPIVPDDIKSGRPAPPALEEEKKQDEEVRGNTVRKYPTMVWAERIEYWYQKGQRRAVITGKPQARQDLPGGRWRHAWTVRGEYDGEAETLKLISSEGKKDTRMKNSIGDDLIAKWLTVSTKEEGEDEMEGEGVEGTVMSDDDDLNNRQNPPPGGTKPPALRGQIGA